MQGRLAAGIRGGIGQEAPQSRPNSHRLLDAVLAVGSSTWSEASIPYWVLGCQWQSS